MADTPIEVPTGNLTLIGIPPDPFAGVRVIVPAPGEVFRDTFDANINGWTDNSTGDSFITWAQGGYLLIIETFTSDAIADRQLSGIDIGDVYILEYEIIEQGAVGPNFFIGSSQGAKNFYETKSISLQTPGVHRDTFISTVTNPWVRINNSQVNNGSSIKLDNISIYKANLTLTGFIPVIHNLHITISDSLSYNETFTENITGGRILTDTLRNIDDPKVGWKFFINESFNLSELLTVDWIISVVDQIFMSDDITPQGEYGIILQDLIDLLDFPFQRKEFADIIAENFNLSDAVTDLHNKISIITELLIINEQLINTGTFQQFLSEELNLAESLEKLFTEIVSEVFNLSETVSDKAIFLTPISDAFTVSDIVSEIFTASVSVIDTLQGTDSTGNQATLFILSNDEVLFNSEIVVDGHTFACWVLTTKGYNPSVYSNFDFNSYARISNKLYGARKDGIYLLEGADDAGDAIHTGLLFDFANMDIPATKRLRTIHLGSETTQATVQVATNRNINRTYKTKHQRTVIGKEVRGKFWTVAIEDVENLKSMELNVVLISKSR